MGVEWARRSKLSPVSHDTWKVVEHYPEQGKLDFSDSRIGQFTRSTGNLEIWGQTPVFVRPTGGPPPVSARIQELRRPRGPARAATRGSRKLHGVSFLCEGSKRKKTFWLIARCGKCLGSANIKTTLEEDWVASLCWVFDNHRMDRRSRRTPRSWIRDWQDKNPSKKIWTRTTTINSQSWT